MNSKRIYVRFKSFTGEIVLLDFPINAMYYDDLALVHLTKDLIGTFTNPWELVDVPTGLYICSGKTKKECIELFENKIKERYINYKTNNAYYYRQKVELQELIKAHEEGGKKDG